MIGPAIVWGLPLAPLTRREAAEAVMDLIDRGRSSFIVTANVHYAMLTAEREDLRRVNDRAAFLVADGAPLVWASRRGPTPLPERVAGSDLIYDLAGLAASRGKSVYFLGGAEGVAAEAARRLVALHPALDVVGIASPPRESMRGEGVARVIADVRAARPDLLVLAMSMPEGELWMDRHIEALGVPAMIQIGAAIDFVAGRVRRAPKVFQKIGMEWAYRIYTDPKRLAPRYARNARFLLTRVVRDLFARRSSGSVPAVEAHHHAIRADDGGGHAGVG